MSTTHRGGLESARRFNAARSLPVPDAALRKYPGLSAPRASADFVEAVYVLQWDIWPDQPTHHDGKYGTGTATAAAKRYAPVADGARHFLRAGLRLPLTGTRSSRLVTWESPRGLDLHGSGHRARKAPPTCVVWHWGGLDPAHCRRVLANRGLSSHFGVGRGVTYQWLDLDRSAFHAGWINGQSVGVDLCQQPETKWAGHYGDLATIDNPSSPRRGARQVLELHPDLELAAAELMVDLSRALGIPLAIPADDGLMSRAALRGFRGHAGYHHLSAPKWDPAPYLRGIDCRALEVS